MWQITLVSCIRSVFLFQIRYLKVIIVKVLYSAAREDGEIVAWSCSLRAPLGYFILSKWLCSVFVLLNQINCLSASTKFGGGFLFAFRGREDVI